MDLKACRSAPNPVMAVMSDPDLHAAFADPAVKAELTKAVLAGINIMDLIKSVMAWIVAHSTDLLLLKDIVLKVIEIIRNLLPKPPTPTPVVP